MANEIFDIEAYRKFSEELKTVLKGPNIRHVDLKWLEPRAREHGTRTKYGSYGWRSFVSSRIAPSAASIYRAPRGCCRKLR